MIRMVPLPRSIVYSPSGKDRTIAALFTHMHNVRTKWVSR
jgi:hypothetical protein